MTKLGKYTLLEQLGHGGFGTVYKATDALGRTVAIKVLRSDYSDDADAIQRFQREARAAGELFHPHIATLLDYDEVDGRRFLVMRYIDGPSLKQLIAQRGRLPWPEALRILQQVSAGLNYAHQRGFIHRDVKPANILVSPQDGAVLTDFGLVKAAQGSTMTATGALLGTFNYIAPEIWLGQPTTPATDVYSLGCVVYEMLTGQVLFAGDSSAQVMMKHMVEGPRLPAAWPSGVPAGLSPVLLRALAKEVPQRYQSTLELTQAMTVLGSPAPQPPVQQPVAPRPAAPPPQAVPPPATPPAQAKPGGGLLSTLSKAFQSPPPPAPKANPPLPPAAPPKAAPMPPAVQPAYKPPAGYSGSRRSASVVSGAPVECCCPSCSTDFKVRTAGKVVCPDCKWDFEVDEDGTVIAGEPIEVTCPNCYESYTVHDPGKQVCSACKWDFEVDESGEVTDGEPIEVTCPSCSETYNVRDPGKQVCPACKWDFTIDESGEVTEGEPIDVYCPNCEENFMVRAAGWVHCPSCKWFFQVAED